MKKEYRKPQVFIENFEISSFVAASCDINRINSDFGGINLFDSNTCDYKMAEDGVMSYRDGEQWKEFDYASDDQNCYHGPTRNGFS